jgi:hypothetical protein
LKRVFLQKKEGMKRGFESKIPLSGASQTVFGVKLGVSFLGLEHYNKTWIRMDTL